MSYAFDSIESFSSILTKAPRLFNARGFTVKEIHCDREFKPSMDSVKGQMGIEMRYPLAGDHIPEAERLNRVIGERLQAIYHDLPYKNLPEVMWKYLTMIATDSLNWLLVKGGASKYYSPHTLLRQQQLDYTTDFVASFGSFVQAYKLSLIHI